MKQSVNFSGFSVQRNPFSEKFFTRKSVPSPEKLNDLSGERLVTESFDSAHRFYRLSSRNEIHDPITGNVRKYQVCRRLSPLGMKNEALVEKVTSTSRDGGEYNFHRQTKRNPKYHNINPITGETSMHRVTRSIDPFDYQLFNYTPDMRKSSRKRKLLSISNKKNNNK